MASFSKEFQDKLQTTIKSHEISPQQAVNDLETYLSNSANGQFMNKDSGYMLYTYVFPQTLQNSDNKTRIECLKAIHDSFTSCGFTALIDTAKIYNGHILPGQFIFAQLLPHLCDFGCQKDGECPKNIGGCTYDHPNCTQIIVCM